MLKDNNVNVLVVEDNEMIITMINYTLEELGLSAEVAKNLDEAKNNVVKLLELGKDLIILLDGNFPGVEKDTESEKKIAAIHFLEYLENLIGDFKQKIFIVAISAEEENNKKMKLAAKSITSEISTSTPGKELFEIETALKCIIGEREYSV